MGDITMETELLGIYRIKRLSAMALVAASMFLLPRFVTAEEQIFKETKIDCANSPITAHFSNPTCKLLTSGGDPNQGFFKHYNLIGEEGGVFGHIIFSEAVRGHLYAVRIDNLRKELARVFDWVRSDASDWSEPESIKDIKIIGFRYKNYVCKGFNKGLNLKYPGFRHSVSGAYCKKGVERFSRVEFELLFKEFSVR